jgi:hypothetical protein
LAQKILWLRVFVEGAVIVVSILLAFGIDAWWQDSLQRATERQQLGVLQAEIGANQAEFEARRQRGIGAREAQNTLIDLISPEKHVIPVDSLAHLLLGAWAFGIVEVESGAIDALLDSGDFRTSMRTDLYRLLVRYRVELADHENEDRMQFIELRTRLLEYVGSVAPGAFVFGRSDFPVPVAALLRDQQLEAVVSQLSVRTGSMNRTIEELISLSDSISVLLDREGPF